MKKFTITKEKKCKCETNLLVLQNLNWFAVLVVSSHYIVFLGVVDWRLVSVKERASVYN